MVRWLLGVKNNQSKSGNSTLRMLTAILHSDGDLTEQGKMRSATKPASLDFCQWIVVVSNENEFSGA